MRRRRAAHVKSRPPGNEDNPVERNAENPCQSGAAAPLCKAPHESPRHSRIVKVRKAGAQPSQRFDVIDNGFGTMTVPPGARQARTRERFETSFLAELVRSDAAPAYCEIGDACAIRRHACRRPVMVASPIKEVRPLPTRCTGGVGDGTGE